MITGIASRLQALGMLRIAHQLVEIDHLVEMAARSNP